VVHPFDDRSALAAALAGAPGQAGAPGEQAHTGSTQQEGVR
jgi:hypothetical protein